MKKRTIGFCLAVVLLVSLVSVGFVDGQPASKAAAKTADFTLINWQQNNMNWTPILSTTIKTSQQKDLFVDASFESGLYTKTTVKSRDMISDTSNATAGIQMRVLLDGKVVAYPGEVVFAKRTQELSATLQGQIALVDKDGDGIIEEGELASVAPEEISLLLDTLNANSFNFILENAGTGVHTVEVQAKIDLGTAAQNGSAEAKAMVGKGSIAVEEVRMIRDAQVEL